jgi:gliding motility-associated-like protein
MNDPASMRIDGTANATVTYTENNVTKTVILDSTGKAILPTGNLKADVTFTLISVSTSIAPICSTTIGGQSLTIKVNLKPVVELEDGYICLHPTTGVTERTYTLKTNLDPTLYSFVWYKSNVVLTGETATSYVVTSTGTYKVKVTNKTTGCSSTDSADVMSSTRPISASVQITTDYFVENGTVVVTALATSSNYEYRLDYGPYQTSNVFENVQNGEHIIYVRDLQNCGEIATAPFIIIDYPKFFTPNGDGHNDTWIINPTKNINNNAIVNAKIYIFDRFGKLLKQISTIGEGWDGTFVGQPMPADDYWFTIQYTENTVNKEFKAHFSLKR